MKYASTLKSIFLKGLFTLLPMVLTLAILNFFFNLIKSWLHPIYELEPEFLQRIYHSEIVLVIMVIFTVGLIVQLFALTHIFERIEQVIVRRIPLLRQIYFGIKQLVSALNPQDNMSFKHVVYVPFLQGGCALGFMTNDVAPSLAPDTEQAYVSVFVPTTPNPTTGFYLVVPKKSCTIVNLTRQEAMALIISGGIVQPERPHAAPPE